MLPCEEPITDAHVHLPLSRTGMKLQDFIPEDPPGRDDDAFVQVEFHACGSVHLVNPKADGLRADVKT